MIFISLFADTCRGAIAPAAIVCGGVRREGYAQFLRRGICASGPEPGAGYRVAMDRIVMFPGPMQEPARVPEAGPRLIGAGHASMLCGLSEAQMARLAEAGAFPRGLRVEQPGRRRGGVTLYAEAEIRAWIAERLRERDERAASADGGRGPSGSPRR